MPKRRRTLALTTRQASQVRWGIVTAKLTEQGRIYAEESGKPALVDGMRRVEVMSETQAWHHSRLAHRAYMRRYYVARPKVWRSS